MPYVSRDHEGRINGVFAIKQPGFAEELLSDDAPELAEFRNRMFFPSLSRRQFYQILALKRLITFDEALAAVQHGEIPKLLEEFIDQHVAGEEERFGVKMLLVGAAEFQRQHSLVTQIGQAFELSGDEINAIWQQGIALT